MYKTDISVLPKTGAAVAAVGGLEFTGHQMLAVGLILVIAGVILFKLTKFKIKDIKTRS